MSPTLTTDERRDLMRVLDWCGPDMVEWGLLAWGNRTVSGRIRPSSRDADWAGGSCFIGEMGGGEMVGDNTPRELLVREAPLRVQTAIEEIFRDFEDPDWRIAARPIIEGWLAEQRGAA